MLHRHAIHIPISTDLDQPWRGESGSGRNDYCAAPALQEFIPLHGSFNIIRFMYLDVGKVGQVEMTCDVDTRR